MKGDKLVIQEFHVRAAESIADLLVSQILATPDRFVISIAGESGSGKSEIAVALSESLAHKGVLCAILQQDDYFAYPPKTNAAMRKADIGQVGPSEVHLGLLDQHLNEVKRGSDQIRKPLVVFEDDMITKETFHLDAVKAVIVEGTYTTTLQNVDQRVFIDRTYLDTKESRRQRAREEQDSNLEQLLEIEHAIISSHKMQADLIVSRDYEVRKDDGQRP